MKTGIDLKQFKKFIEKEIGKRCKGSTYGCLICSAWDLYDHLADYLWYLGMLNDNEMLPMPKGEPHK
jgi:hypothetical protein